MFTPLEEDYRTNSGGRSEEAHPLSGPLSWQGLDVQLNSHTNQFGQMVGSNLQRAPLTVWECAPSPGVRAYCYAGLIDFPYRTITLARVMSTENFGRGGFPLPSCSLGFGVSFSHDGHVLFYRHGISIPCQKNSINVLKVLKLYCC